MSSARSSSNPNAGNIGLIFVTLIIVMLLASLSQMVLSSALPTIAGELHSVELMPWVITAYMLSTTVMMPIYGKLSDLLGRKPLLLAAILAFVLGSVLGGLAPDMITLIIARAIQGLGGGGLIILSQAAIADVVPARDRGKYMGIMGGAFAFSSVAGPLLGGWITEGPGWRWAFWMNVPLGAIALVATVMLLKLPAVQRAVRPSIDYLGMMLLVVQTAAVVLIGTWGGSVYEWDSPVILGLATVLVVAVIAFIHVESHAVEPVMPMFMFRERNFVLTTISSLLVALAMFGVVGYMPTYFQMAVGASATVAGLLMVPMMACMLITSIGTGVMVSRSGRYKTIPIVGALILTAGVALLSTVQAGTSVVLICVFMALIGVGLGANMQILTLIVQNTFRHELVGTATAANNYFRQVGSSLGAAVVGAVFTVRLTSLLQERLPAGAAPADGASSLTPAFVLSLPEGIRSIIVGAYNDALIPVFVYMFPLGVITAVLLWFMHEKPLATKVEREVGAPPASGERLATRSAD